MRIYLSAKGEAGELLGATLADLGHVVVNDAAATPLAGVQQAEARFFIAEVDRMLEADVLVAEASEPSHDVGWAAAWFLARGRLVILCVRRAERPRLAPLLAGNPSPWQRIVLYDDAEDLRAKVASTFKS